MKEQLIAFLSEKFPNLKFTDLELDQLLWRFESKDASPEKSVATEQFKYTPQQWQFGQMQRTGASLNCIRLFELGEQGYDEFVQKQAENLDAYNQVLSKEDYLKLVARFEDKDVLYMDALRVATIIQMITLSPRAKANADRVLGENNYVEDSVEFLADTFKDIECARKIYPLVDELFNKYPEQQQRLSTLLQNSFASNQHFRHMLYTECNQNGFANLFEKIKTNTYESQNDHGFLFWFDFWLVNVTGFRGNLAHEGSVYLTHNTMQAIEALQETFEQSFNKPVSAQEMLNGYLSKRSKMLGLDNPKLNLNSKEQNVLAHVGALMRLFHPEQGNLLCTALISMPQAHRELTEVYFSAQEGEPSPTYVPAVFANGIDVLKKVYAELEGLNRTKLEQFSEVLAKKGDELRSALAIVDAIQLFLPFYLNAIKQYRENVKDNKLPLSFKEVARSGDIEKLFEGSNIFDRLKNQDVEVKPELDDKNMLSYKLVDLKPKLLTTQFEIEKQKASEQPEEKQQTSTHQKKTKLNL